MRPPIKKVLEVNQTPHFCLLLQTRMRRKCILLAVYLAYKKSLPRLSRLVVPVDENFPFMLPITIRCNSCSEYVHQGSRAPNSLSTRWGTVFLSLSLSLSIFLFPRYAFLWDRIYMMLRRSAVYLLPCFLWLSSLLDRIL